MTTVRVGVAVGEDMNRKDTVLVAVGIPPLTSVARRIDNHELGHFGTAAEVQHANRWKNAGNQRRKGALPHFR